MLLGLKNHTFNTAHGIGFCVSQWAQAWLTNLLSFTVNTADVRNFRDTLFASEISRQLSKN